MAQEIAFGAPRAEEMKRVVASGAGAGITGVVEGVVIKMAPELGAAQPIFTWGTLLGIPLVGVAGALFTRGLLGDLLMGIACGGLGVVGYSLPEMLVPITGKKGPQLTAEQRAALAAAGGAKLLGGGAATAAQRAQAMAALAI